MYNGTISRAAFIQAIEAGIASGRGLEPFQKARLRLVALGADEVTVGLFRTGSSAPGCPLTQAGMGLGTEFEGDLIGRSPLTAFYEGFDRVMRDVVGHTGCTITVVE